MKLRNSLLGGLFLISIFIGKLSAFQTINGTVNGKEIWRSSDVSNNQVNMFISTGHVVIGYVFISSPGINSNIVFQQAWSSHSTFNFPTFFGSSVPWDGGSQPISTDRNNYGDGMKYIMQRSTWGWKATMTGDTPARLRIFWDYIEPPRP